MNKTILTTSMILCLLWINLTKAATTDFIIPASAYSITSEAGTFTDIADNLNTVKFGADLTANTSLQNVFFVNDNETPFVTHVADKTKTDPGFPLGFTFNFCGKEMTHFTICASGGIFLGAGENIKQGQSQSWHAFFGGSWANADLQNIISVITKDAAGNINTAQSVAGKSPVMYLIEGEAGAKVLTVQYDYTINGDEWIYQIKVYENGNVELVVGNLATANAGGNTRLFIGLVEDGNYTVSNDEFTKLNVQDVQYLGMTQTEAASWNTVAAYTNTSTTPDGLFVTADNTPESGRTLTFKAPADCAEKAQKFEDAWYGFNTTKITKTSFTGNISFNTNSITPAQMTAAGTLVAVLSASETPDYTLSNGTWYQAGNKLGDNRVLINAKPRYSIDASGFSSMYTMALSASGLTEATTYYIHIYAMDYRCTGAPVYSDLCRTFSFTTSIDLPKTLSAGLPTTSSVPVTVQPADGEGFGVVLFKSPNTNALKLSGNLTPGQKIGDAEVLTVITAHTATVYNVPFEAGEGAYILAYSVINPDAETPAYGQDFLNIPVRAAYDNLPVNLGFENESLSKELPFGWSRESAWPTDQNSSPFRLSYIADDDKTICLKSTYPAASIKWTDWADVVTPAFALPTGKTRISVTYFLSYTQNKGQGNPTQYKPTATDLMRIEYSVNGGAWEEALNINGHDDDFPQINTDKQYPLNVTINDLSAGSVIRLRYSCKSPTTGDAGTISTFIHAVSITEGKTCNRPIALQMIDSLTTDARLTFHWLDFDNLPVAPTSLLSYREAEGDGAWRGVRVATPANTTNETPIEGSVSGLKAGTAYYVRVAALCGRNDTSFYTEPMTVRTAYELPYNESMAKTGSGTTAKTPFDRGVKTYSGVIGGQLTETTELQNGWNQDVTSNKFGVANTVSVGDFVTNAWLMIPAIFIRETGDFTPKSLNFTLSGFDADKNKGAKPNYTSTKLHIVASDNGLFTQESIIKTLDADSLACIDRAFTVDLTEWEGYLQVAFVFECPDGVQNATEGEDTEERPDPWYLEISQLRIKYDADVCFPIKNLSRSAGIDEVSLTWEASTSAVEYGIFWRLYNESAYIDSAFTTEPHYTITGLKDQTRYRAIVVAYCNEDRSLAADPVGTNFYTMIGCHMPENFQVNDITFTGAEFVSTSDQSEPGGYLTHRLVYLTPDNGGETLTFIQTSDTLRLHDTLLEATTYTATTQALCEEAYSPMSQAIRFTTLKDTTGDTSAIESLAQLNGLFSVRTQDGRVVIRNLNQLLVRNVSVFNLSGIKLAEFRTDSRDDLYLPVNARQLLIFVRLQTERGTVVYKIYLP